MNENTEKLTFTKERIFRDLEAVLSPYEWTVIQNTSEKDARRCGLCDLGFMIKKYIYGPHGSSLVNPNFPVEDWKFCTDRFKDEPGFECVNCIFKCGFLTDGICELAFEFWNAHRTHPHYNVPPMPPLVPPDPPSDFKGPTERWVDFVLESNVKGTGKGYYQLILYPQTIRRFEWEKKYFRTESLDEFIEKHFWKLYHSWVDSLGKEELHYFYIYRERDTKPWIKEKKYIETEFSLEDGWEISLKKNDGSLERLPGIFYEKRQGGRRKRRFEAWYGISVVNALWIEKNISTTDEFKRKKLEFLAKQTLEIDDYLKKEGLNGCREPEENKDFAVSDDEADVLLKGLVSDFMSSLKVEFK